jgi:hypothetical protein
MGLALVIALIAMASRASSAGAASFHYCGLLTPPYTACSQVADSNSAYFYDNVAAYGGSGTVSVCQKVYTWWNGAQISRRCANGSVGTAGDLVPYAGLRMIAYVGNNSAYNHTIDGYAYY